MAEGNQKREYWRGKEDILDARMGFDLFSYGEPRLGWLTNFNTGTIEDSENSRTLSCVNLYFICQDGSKFKAQAQFPPYFYIKAKENLEHDVDVYLRRRFEGRISSIEEKFMEDLDQKNHLAGPQPKYLKVSFYSVQDLMDVKKELLPAIAKTQAAIKAASNAYGTMSSRKVGGNTVDYLESIIDIREYDVQYHMRYAIDTGVRCGLWYDVSVENGKTSLDLRKDLVARAEVGVCAFDIECTKLPLKFPDASFDAIMMISYVLDGQGYLIVNREFVGEDINDLEYSPKPEFSGYFKVLNVAKEEDLLHRWFEHMRAAKPGVFVTYNGDNFDWPFIEQRAAHHGISMYEEIGFRVNDKQGECRSRFASHLDAYAWVKRDSYLPQGSQGLKAVTKSKLGYQPLEVDPENMVRFAIEQPQIMASYSVSDALATYYLYMKYVHPFIFSLATIIPMSPDEVLRKGSGTLCEALLMVQAYINNIICPNKNVADEEKFYNNHLLESETYIGGHVECLESGVFRSDLPLKFRLVPSAYQTLIDNLDRDLTFAIEEEAKMELSSITNYEEVKSQILEKLESLRDKPNREECPLIYHLDVAAMYPNIILTNRLQPPSIVTDDICAACDYNRPGKTCLRKLDWIWRGETFMATRSEYNQLKNQIEVDRFTHEGETDVGFRELSKEQQQVKLQSRLKKYCQKVYKRVLDKPFSEKREAGICMRENPFYVDTVKSFRDRRYEYKGLTKKWKGELGKAEKSRDPIKIQEAEDMCVLYDSLQLAHKCILNSFYGYVMRKGARWYSMEMAGVVTYTGAKIIQNARLLVEQIGRPLELDTDGIWCCLPESFPENYVFVSDTKKKLTISYPCVMLNVDVFVNNTNPQYQTKDKDTGLYKTSSECSISFEVDGPYKAMILPASKEEGAVIKKRYAVFNHDGSLAELKGFEVKRRGELKLIKVFQAEVFDKFLQGETLEECYDSVAAVADRWLDMLETKGEDLADSELIDYISESTVMSKSLADFGDKRSCAVTTAKRLADFLGDTVVKEKGLLCQYIVSKKPEGLSVSDRAIPVAIFQAEPEVKRLFLQRWCKESGDVNLRSIVDWQYYVVRLGSAIQKIITIPAAMQKVTNPVPRVKHPDWLFKQLREKNSKFQQRGLAEMLSGMMRKQTHAPAPSPQNPGPDPAPIVDIDSPIRTSDRPDTPPAQEVEPEEEVSELRSSDRSTWLQMKKRKWKAAMEQRRQSQAPGLGEATPAPREKRPAQAGRDGLRAFFHQKEAQLATGQWQIIQLVASQRPGEFTAWVVAGGDLYKVPVRVPSVFYKNTTEMPTETESNSVTKLLPHAHPCLNLLKVEQEGDSSPLPQSDASSLLTDPNVEGVYESQVPPVVRALLEVGCVCSVVPEARERTIADGWSLDELQMQRERPYFPTRESIGHFFLYQSVSDPRGFYALHLPSTRTMLVVLVGAQRNHEVNATLLERFLSDVPPEALEDTSIAAANINYKVEYVQNATAAAQILQRTLLEQQSHLRGPTVALVESPNFKSLTKLLPVLLEFPCLPVPANAHHSLYQPLGWQLHAARLAMQRCMLAPLWFKERLDLARYAQIPVGNLEADCIIFCCDVMFARTLHDSQQLIWMSESGFPDLGGVTEEQELVFSEELSPSEIQHPGAYRSVCVDLKISHLAVNALLKYNQVNEMECGALLGQTGAPVYEWSAAQRTYFDESVACAAAFQSLTQMAQGWVRNAINGHRVADLLLSNLYRWISSSSSRLHDSAIQRRLCQVMVKVLALLLSELQKLGAVIVFADFSRVVLATGKRSLMSASSHVTYLLETLKKRELFEWIDLTEQEYWHSLLFMDKSNFSGVAAKMGEQGGDPDSSENSAMNGDLPQDEFELRSEWSLAKSMPRECQEYLRVLAGEYVYSPWKHRNERSLEMASQVSSQAVLWSSAEADKEELTYISSQIQGYYTGKLIKIVEEISRLMDGAISREAGDTGQSASKSQIALEFTKVACEIIRIDSRFGAEVQVMKRQLLRIVDVPEFSDTAQFVKPSSSFMLPNIVCSFCNNMRDLDLSNDEGLKEGGWRCNVPNCGQSYDQEMIENALIQVLRHHCHQIQLQDYSCKKCGQVKGDHISERCSCGGQLLPKKGPAYKSSLSLLLSLSKEHQFFLLQEMIVWMIGFR